jgi:hypothetical protein
MGENRVAYGILVWRPEGKLPLGRPKRRREDNIKICVQEVGWSAWTRSIGLSIQTRGGF